MGWFAALANTRARMQSVRRQTDDENAQFAALRDGLVMADAGAQTAADIVRAAEKSDAALSPSVRVAQEVGRRLQPLQANEDLAWGAHKPFVVLVMGVNGGGKTTTIAKLCRHFADQGKSVLLAAGDTFRAAARQQLQTWATQLGVAEVVTANEPGAVAYNAIVAAAARGCDIVLIDTAGRLPSQAHLMQELTKIQRAANKAAPGAPHENWLVLDATTGRHALQQIALFSQVANVSGLIVSKLDGSAKAGFLVDIAAQYPIPLRFVGVGERAADLQPFDAAAYAESLVS